MSFLEKMSSSAMIQTTVSHDKMCNLKNGFGRPRTGTKFACKYRYILEFIVLFLCENTLLYNKFNELQGVNKKQNLKCPFKKQPTRLQGPLQTVDSQKKLNIYI